MRSTKWGRPGLGSSGVIALALACVVGLARPATATASQATSASPTWADLYTRYMAAGTVGDCGSCHAEATTAERTYTWLATQQYMAGSGPYLLDPRASCLSWLGGDMPPDGPSKYTRATRDFTAWANAQKHAE